MKYCVSGKGKGASKMADQVVTKILIVRNPAFSEKVKRPSTFMTEDKNKTVTIRRLNA